MHETTTGIIVTTGTSGTGSRLAKLLTNERGKKLWSRAACRHECRTGHILTELQVLNDTKKKEEAQNRKE